MKRSWIIDSMVINESDAKLAVRYFRGALSKARFIATMRNMAATAINDDIRKLFEAAATVTTRERYTTVTTEQMWHGIGMTLPTATIETIGEIRDGVVTFRKV